jgi:hypothetical protein
MISLAQHHAREQGGRATWAMNNAASPTRLFSYALPAARHLVFQGSIVLLFGLLLGLLPVSARYQLEKQTCHRQMVEEAAYYSSPMARALHVHHLASERSMRLSAASVPGVNYFERRVASRRNVTRPLVVVWVSFFDSLVLVEGCGHVGEGCGGGQRSRAALRCPRSQPVRRRRIVHMSIACRARSARPPRPLVVVSSAFRLLPPLHQLCADRPGPFP